MTDVKEVVSWQRRDQFTSVVQVRHFDFLLSEKMLADDRTALGSNNNNHGV